MKVMVAAPTFLPSHRANTIQVMKMAQALQSIGHRVRVLVPGLTEGEKISWVNLASHYGLYERLDIRWLPVKPRFRGYDYGYSVIRNFNQWVGDILYTRLPQAAAFASLLNIPTIFEVHDLPGGRAGTLLFSMFLKGRGARRLVLISKSLRDEINQQFSPLPEAPFTLIAPDGVDLYRYKAIPTSIEARILLKKGALPRLPVHAFTIGYTGNFYVGRGTKLILELAQHLPDFSFLLVGGDPKDVQTIQTQVQELRLNNVFLTGFVHNSKLPEFQAACDVLLMPYQYTVAASSGGNIAQYLSPMKLFEYLACGRVILSSDLPVIREVLNERNAILLPPDDVSAWITALQQICEDHTQQYLLAKQAREDSKRYTWKSRAEKIFSSGFSPLKS